MRDIGESERRNEEEGIYSIGARDDSAMLLLYWAAIQKNWKKSYGRTDVICIGESRIGRSKNFPSSCPAAFSLYSIGTEPLNSIGQSRANALCALL